jgi:serine/threonine protein kinase
LKLCFKKDPLERPTADQLLLHPWVVQSATPMMSPITPQVRKSNSTILNNYVQKTVSKDDMLILDSQIIPRGSHSMKVTSPSSNITLPPPPPLPAHNQQSATSFSLSTLQSKSLFVNKFNQRQYNGNSMARQSMPAIVVTATNQPTTTTKQQDHVHNLIECSFPKGKKSSVIIIRFLRAKTL